MDNLREEKPTRIVLSDSVLENLEKMIGKMQPGERLPTEAALSEQFSVGRSTIRESLKVLSYKKIIVRRSEGTFVAEKSPNCFVDSLNLILNLDTGNINELIELRELLETSSVRLAARRALPEEIESLKRKEWLFEEPGISEKERSQRDLDFHVQLASCAKNQILKDLLKAVKLVLMDGIKKPSMPQELFEEGKQLHERIVSAVAEHNETEAVMAMEEYLTTMDFTS